MKITPDFNAAIGAPASLRATAAADWKVMLAGSVFCFLLASVLMSGWPAGLLPDLSYPYIYAGDGLSHSWIAERAIEGWIFDNARSGYPFGSNFLDYPGSDSGNLLVLKIFGKLTGTYYGALNLYFLTGFAGTFASAFLVMRTVGIGRALAVAGAVLFSFVPFHFQRLGHLFYTWYFVAPLFFYAALRIAAFQSGQSMTARRGARWAAAAILLALGAFGVYYAVFGLILLSTVALAGLLAGSGFKSLRFAAVAACLVIAGVLLNIGPNLAYQYKAGVNTEVAQRNPAESEIHGFKMVQLLLPRPDHRSGKMRQIAQRYAATFPMVHENFMSSLGFVAAVGFLCSLLVAAAAIAGRPLERNLRLIALMTLVLFLFGTIGAFGSLFSQLISSSIRGWNRISIFIAFGGLLTLLMLLQAALRRRQVRKPLAVAGLAAAITLFGLYDQTVPACASCIKQTKGAFELDRDFIGAIEHALPAGSAVYQLPYMGFPEVMPQVRLQTYDLAAGFLLSRTLKWSYAGMKGRDGDAFYRALAQESAAKQLDVVRRLGFAGLYIDRRGYEDKGQAIIDQFTALLGVGPSLQRADKEVVFFPLTPVSVNPDQLLHATHAALMVRSDFMVDHLGKRSQASLAQGIDFTGNEFPIFVKNVVGMAGPEPWGRWTDANAAKSAHIEFAQALPQRFTLVLKARPFGPNAGKDLTVKIGPRTLRINLKEGEGEYRQAVDLGDARVTRIEFLPALPISPMSLGWNTDTRLLGVGLIRLALE